MTVNVASWINVASRGDRTSFCTITTDCGLDAGVITGFIDGTIDFSSGTHYFIFNNGQTGKHILFDFGSQPQMITGFIWYEQNSINNGTWKLQGSNDNSTWLDITAARQQTVANEFTASTGVNDDFYQYYRLTETAGTTNNFIRNLEIEFLAVDGSGADDRSAIAPSYGNLLGTGDRRDYMSIGGTTATTFGGGLPDWLDGNTASTQTRINPLQSGTYIELDFRSDVLITEVKFYQPTPATHGTWKWQHFDRSSMAWVDVGSAFTFGSGSGTQTITEMSGETDYFQLYRIQQVSGAPDFGAIQGELEFKIGYPQIPFTPPVAPDITGVAPNTGYTTGGDSITITGTALTGTTDVQFDTTSATSIVVVDDNTITCDNPAHAAGAVDVTVFNPAGDNTAPGAFTYLTLPGARITQTPLLVLDSSPQATHITQTPILILFIGEEPMRVTQTPILALYEPKPVPLPSPVVPETPLSETWAWNTAISIAHNSQEQRSRLREVPRYKLQMSVFLLNEADRVHVYNMLMRFLKTPFIYPFYQYGVKMTQDAVVSDTKLYCNTSETDVRDGESVVVYNPHLETTTYYTVDTVDSDGVNLTDALLVDVPGYCQICPAIDFRILSGVGLTMRNIDGDLALTMESVSPRVFQRPGAAPTLTTIDDILIVPERVLADTEVPETFIHGAEWFDNGMSVPDILNEWSNPHVTSIRRYKYDRRLTTDYWRAVCDSLKGSQGVALFPTFRNDLPLRDAMVLNSKTFTTNNVDFFLWYLDNNYRYVAINTQNGMKYRKVSGVQPHYDAGGSPDYLTITLDTSTGNVAGDNVVSTISYMNLCRLNSDEVKLSHYELDTQIEFTIRAVDQ